MMKEQGPSPGVVADYILSPKALEARLGLSESTILRLRQRRDLPQPLRLSGNRIGWREGDIAKWLDARRRAQR